ncbi:hypothetical protein [Neisseria weaveri]|uniref:Uncharacterized protein n=1 Tax=Neisseria weaveri TaxID=28091 RepID=A0A3S4Z5L4_9NEIS|nr:hypothetical protein [Neisseria weaveri]EGV38921.1 hypothetical protein l11_00840 [Neisseria weaveri LMG 5135]VEJ49067.1 Uncharacterised protein [Neisseria weaveri]
MKKLTLQLISLIDRDSLVVEIWEGDNQFAEVYMQNGEIQIDIFPILDRDYWTFNLYEIQDSFGEAIKLLGNK